MTATQIAPGQPATTVEIGGAPVKQGTLVRYHGSITEAHGYYRVVCLIFVDRYVLQPDEGEDHLPSHLASVGRASFTVVK